MSGEIDARLAELGIELPVTAFPAANYVPYVQIGDMVYVSGQISINPTAGSRGKLGADISNDEGYAAARICGENLLAQLKAACGGDLDRVVQVVRLGGFVNCTPDFVDHPAIINGSSDLMVEVFGEKGRHARAAVGTSSLPFGVSVEVEGLFQIA